MKYKLLKDLYDCFYTPPELPTQKQKIEECHQALSEVLGKPERRLVLQIIDAKDRIAEDTSIDSFIAGFELAWKLQLPSALRGSKDLPVPSQLPHHRKGSAAERKLRAEVCGRSGGEGAHPHRAQHHHHEGRPRAQRKSCLHHPSHSGSAGAELSAAVSSGGA